MKAKKGVFHLECHPGEVAERVIVCGAPERVQRASKLLENAELVSGKRGLLVYTGGYKGAEVTVATTGMGGASAAIVAEELIELGAKTIIRVGTTGALQEEVDVGDLIVVEGAVPLDGTSRSYSPEGFCPASSSEVVLALREAARELGEKRIHVGLVCSTDAFYLEDVDFVEKWSRRKVLSVEMECAAIITVARIRGVKAGGILVVNGNLKKEVAMVSHEEIADREEMALRMAMEALLKVPL
ncbi:MAG: nucleoside phosphorylase [Candidatus Verstraetearchaeota archaeon]|nr:nucleoside phosphorylase [Candidatus Verstraetearchaeota archaeon]